MEYHSLHQLALSLGFCDAALCSAADFHAQQLLVFSQPPLSERKQLRYSPSQDDERISSLLVLLWPYRQHASVDGELFIDSYYQASNAAYHAAKVMEAHLSEEGIYAKANTPYPAKEAAVRAGLGYIGHNSLFYHRIFGSRVVIILVATSLNAPSVSAECEKQTCIGCLRCVKSCPSGAIDEHGMSHPERCLRNFMMEGIVVPKELRRAMGNRLLGCDVCQRVCPMQSGNEASHSGWKLDDFLTNDTSVFSAQIARLGSQIGRNTARPQRVRAQAALLCGNIGKKAHLPVLRKWADSEFEAVRTHALWAICEIEAKHE